MKIKEPMIVLQQVGFSYDNASKVFESLDLQIYRGETVAIVGANGAGKSTLMKLITGLERPSSGEISVCGLQATSKNMNEIRKKVGYTFQNPDNQLFMPSVYEDVAFSLRRRGVPELETQTAVDNALSQVGGQHLKEKASYKMSGGEKRLITLASVLIDEPEILLLDEPTVGLDPKARRQLIRLLMNRSETKVITTHDMDMALVLCDRIIVLCDGTIQGDDTPQKIFSNRQLLCDNNLELPLRMQGCPICGAE